MGRPGLTQHRKFRRLARTLNGEAVARGCLEFLWDSCYENGDDYLGDSHDVEAAARWTGDQSVLTAALLNAGGDDSTGFIQEIPDRPGRYSVHDLWHHAPDYVRKRRQREAGRRSKTDPVAIDGGQRPDTDRSLTGKRQPSPYWQTGVDLPRLPGVVTTPAPAPAPKEQEKPALSEQSSDVAPPSSKKLKPEPSREAAKLASLLKAEILRNKADFKITQSQERSWAVTADRMLRLDGRTQEQVADLIRWAQQDEFWMGNILSMDKLREKFDQLGLKQRANGKSSPPKVPPPRSPVEKMQESIAADLPSGLPCER